MKKARLFALLLTATLAISALTAYGYVKVTGSKKTIAQADACFVDFDKNRLVNDADAIVSGKVVSSEVQDDFKGFPATDYMIKVDKVFKGDPGTEVEVRTEGGENAKMKYIAEEGFAKFQVGEKVVLFLVKETGPRPDKDDFGYYVLGEFQGKFLEENGKLKNKKLTFDTATFAQELDRIEKENKAKGLKRLEPGSESDI